MGGDEPYRVVVVDSDQPAFQATAWRLTITVSTGDDSSDTGCTIHLETAETRKEA